MAIVYLLPVLTNFGNKINTITPGYTAKLGLKVRPIEIGVQKINDSTFEIFRIVLASFQVKNKLSQARFLQKIFLLVNINGEIVLNMPFLTFNNADIQFAEQEFI